jgi:outer membrane cobalamin receptor
MSFQNRFGNDSRKFFSGNLEESTLFIGQHAGGGKAEQIFLRGFDIDHGTDIAISVDGMPVNMVSHAHGQADLHFVIPETVER